MRQLWKKQFVYSDEELIKRAREMQIDMIGDYLDKSIVVKYLAENVGTGKTVDDLIRDCDICIFNINDDVDDIIINFPMICHEAVDYWESMSRGIDSRARDSGSSAYLVDFVSDPLTPLPTESPDAYIQALEVIIVNGKTGRVITIIEEERLLQNY